jgi:predicted nucleic acid-binding Zn ribbon protein
MEAIASTLEKVVARNLRRATDAAILAWPVACGSAVAVRTRAMSFRSGVLLVEVPDVGWRAELIQLAPRYLAAINRYSAVPVSRIEFTVAQSGPQSPNAELSRLPNRVEAF